jgi:hypothetical protein
VQVQRVHKQTKKLVPDDLVVNRARGGEVQAPWLGLLGEAGLVLKVSKVPFLITAKVAGLSMAVTNAESGRAGTAKGGHRRWRAVRGLQAKVHLQSNSVQQGRLSSLQG